MSRNALVIAIDGPAGAGKSTVARMLAAMLGLTLLDTGAMYRAVALKATRMGLGGQSSPEELATVAAGAMIAFYDGQPPRLFLDGEDVSQDIRSMEIGQLASEISVHAAVRRVLVTQQQALMSKGGFVLEGRDVTTVVAPNADVKVFLTASIEERARRRWLELKAGGNDVRLQQVVRDVVERDHRDYTRADSPLVLAEDAVVVESFGLTPEQVCERIVELAPPKP